MFKTIRPVGNKITLKQAEFTGSQFPQYQFSFYQSGTAALAAAIQACMRLSGAIASDCEIIVPAYACPDLVSAIHFTGATPIPVDLEPDSPRLSMQHIEGNTNENTLAIIGVNFLGIQDNTQVLKNYCEKRQIFFINDSAQWFPTDDIGDKWSGDFNIVSFGRGKPVSVLHGGAVITTDEHMAGALTCKAEIPEQAKNTQALLKLYLYNLIIQPFFYSLLIRIPGLNIGDTIFKRLDAVEPIEPLYRRYLQTNIEKYRSRESICSAIKSKLKNIQSSLLIDLSELIENTEDFQLLRYPILIKNPVIRDSIYAKTRRLGVSILYPQAINLIPGVEGILDAQHDYPNAREFAAHLLTLPTHEDVNEKDIDEIITIIRSELLN